VGDVVTSGLVAGLAVLLGALAVRAAGRGGGAPMAAPGVPAAVQRAWAAAALPVPASAVWPWWLLATTLGVAAAALFGGPGLALVGLAAAVGGPGGVLLARRGHAARQVEDALPELLDAVGRSLRTGATVTNALREAAAAAPAALDAELVPVVAAIDGGSPFVDALDDWAARRPVRGVRLVAATLALAGESGGAAARAVDGVAATLRANRSVAAEVRAQAAQARYSALVIALCPLGFGLLVTGTDGRMAEFLLRTPVGLACLASGLALDALGGWWMHRITEVAS
jgi:tight adherence protein B